MVALPPGDHDHPIEDELFSQRSSQKGPDSGQGILLELLAGQAIAISLSGHNYTTEHHDTTAP
jgi:hypothetical protein